MKLIPIESSNLLAVGYDDSQQELVVQFRKTGLIYTYSDVSIDEYNTIMQSKSIGKAFIEVIVKSGKLYKKNTD